MWKKSAIIGSVALVALLALVLLLSGRRGDRVKSDRARCMAKLKKISRALESYANRHGGWYPSELEVLLEYQYVDSPALFRCPGAQQDSRGGERAGGGFHTDYVYRGSISREDLTPATLLVADRPGNHEDGGAVIRGDGTVRYIAQEEFDDVGAEIARASADSVTRSNGKASPMAGYAEEEIISRARIIPRPRIEEYGEGTIVLAGPGEGLSVAEPGAEAQDGKPGSRGVDLLAERLKRLADLESRVGKAGGNPRVVVDRCSQQEMEGILQESGAGDGVDGKRLDQAYYLRCCEPQASEDPVVRIKASGEVGLFYGFVSLCQLLERGESGQVRVPEVKIMDWPEIGLRLSKTSASYNTLSELKKFACWMPLYKMNVMGMQFHGQESKELGRFEGNVEFICRRARREGILETVVYFCPFRGEGYDFQKQEDRDAYVELIRWMLDQGAHGIEIDYNDWPDRSVPIPDVINLACDAVWDKRPEAYVLYCPPNRGESQYRGEATTEMHRILSEVPRKVWPLWTGMETFIREPLTPAQVREWTRVAGRRPFLWVNVVSLRARGCFSFPLEEMRGAPVFRGGSLPEDLHALFEGVHFNAGFSQSLNRLPEHFNTEALVYFATAADYVWNPHEWDPVVSVRRAQRFVRIMRPLVGE